MITAPAFIDLHVHLREPGQTHKGDIAHETRAAVAGGFGTIVAMPNTTPAIDTPERFLAVQKLLKEKAACHVIQSACMTKHRAGLEPTDVLALKKAGVTVLSDDGSTTQDDGVMKEVAARAAEAGLLLVDHCEDMSCTRQGEIRLVERDIRIAQETGVRIHLQHLSTREAVALLADARKDGLRVSGEATPHHLALTKAALKTWGTNAKMAPPLREEADRQALIQAVVSGVITAIATDHAPHSMAEKAKSFDQAPNGILGLESAFAVCNKILVYSGEMTLLELINRFTTGPAEILGIPLPKKMVAIVPEGERILDEPEYSIAKNCPWKGFAGWGHVCRRDELSDSITKIVIQD